MTSTHIPTVFTPRLGPDIFRKRLMIEGHFSRDDVNDGTLREYFTLITRDLSLRAYADPIVHRTAGEGKAANEGYDAFVPLIDSGIYVCVWMVPRFLSIILFTCAEFDERRAVATTSRFFGIAEHEAVMF